MKQRAFTLYTEVRPGQVDPLQSLLDEIGDDIDENPHLRFDELRDLHYASFSVVEAADGTPHLLFEGNVDGSVEAFLSQLVTEAGAAVDRIYGHCVGYPHAGSAPAPERVVRYLCAQDIGVDTFYVAWPGWSVEEVRREHELRERIGAQLDESDEELRERTPDVVRVRLQELVAGDPERAWARRPRTKPFLVRHGRKVALVAVAPVLVGLGRTLVTATSSRSTPGARHVAQAALTALAATAGGALWALRSAERADDARERARTADWETTYAEWSGTLPDIVRREDVQVQNHMVSVTDIKEGRFRLLTLRVVLRVIDVVARVSANRGSLGGISTIHFARWVITPDGKRLIFLSNFDGSWERYLTDFIDRAATGLTAVWSNTDNAVGFPSTRWLVRGGARDEARFKAYSRHSMVPTRTWYSAYPNLTVANIANSMEVRRQLFASLDATGMAAWFRRF